MPYALRVRLYRGDVLEADTDPDLEPGAPGAERVADLAASQAALVELCQAMHGPEARLLGYSPLALDAYAAVLRDRAAASPAFTYAQGYSVLTRHGSEHWRAQVDIVALR